jgi:hypothetical protein
MIAAAWKRIQDMPTPCPTATAMNNIDAVFETE